MVVIFFNHQNYFIFLLSREMGRKGNRAATSKNLGRSLTKAPKKKAMARSTVCSPFLSIWSLPVHYLY